MSKPLEFVSQITSFPILSPEDNETGVSVLISKFFKFGRNSPADQSVASGSTSTAEDTHENTNPNEASCNNNENADVASTSQYFDEFGEGRSVHKALRRISSLIQLKASAGTKYSDTEQARYWMPDNVSRECYECGGRFSAFRRRHHCRVCGQIFCARCCSHRVPGHIFNCAGGLRVCTYCCEIVLSYIQSVDGGTVLSADLKALLDKVKDKIPKSNTESLEQGFLMGSGGEMLKEGSVMGDLGGEVGISRHISLQDTFKQLCFSLPLQQHRYRLVRYPGVWRGEDIIQWLLEHTDISTAIQAGVMCQSLMREGLLECVTEPKIFTEYALYKPVNPPNFPVSEHVSPNAVNSITGSISSYCLNLNLAESSAHLVRGQKIDENNEELHSESDSLVPLQSDGGDDSKSFFEIVEATGTEHLRLLLVQELNRAGLNLSWGPILLPLCQQVANMITPDIASSEWDIRRCVRVKRVVGGSMRESRAVGGVIFTKNVAHRGMPTALTSPRLLLLRCSLVYQRVEDKLMSLEPVIMQEQEYLRNCCARILALNPDVVIIQGRVSRIAQDELRRRGIVLVIGVRGPTLYRLARCTRADILTSIDAHVGSPRLGTCKAFYLLNYDSKTLMVFEGYPKDLNGCSIILRGGTLEELGRVKKVTGLVLLSAYNWRLESSLLKDMCATLPTFGTSLMFNDNSKDNSPEKENDLKIEQTIVSGHDDSKILPNPVCKQILQSENDVIKSAVNLKSSSSSTVIDSKLELAVTDPLTSDYSYSGVNKKSDGEKGPSLSCGITVNDFSDPLRSRKMSTDDDVFISHQAVPKTTVYESQVDSLRNRWSADEAVLSMSPHVRICAPYLESELGRSSPLRHYFCTPLYPAPAVIAPSTPKTTNKFRKQSIKTERKDFNLKEPHIFVEKALSKNSEETDVLRLLAHYRAVGGRLPHDDFSKKKFTKNVDSKHEVAVDVVKAKNSNDPLDPECHQRMYLLFCSYSLRSSNAPDFCINPSIVRVELYGNNDVSLGQFLERHCFGQQFVCPSPTCQTPLIQHVRKFVHGDGCVVVTCVTVDSSSSTRLTHEDPKQNVMWWCRCLICGERPGGSSYLRPISLAVSLAKYLESRFNAPRYIKNHACQHSLNQQFAHYFAYGNSTACFRYNKIKLWEICLPPSSIATHYNTRCMRDFLVNQVNELVLKGHEVFGNVGDGEQEKEHAFFKQHIEQIQFNLTSLSLQEQYNSAGIVRWLWNISDAVVIGEKIIQEAMEKLTAQTNAKVGFKIAQDSVVDGKIEQNHDDNILTDYNASDCVGENKVILTNSVEVENTEEEEDKADRRGLRAILLQFLNNSQPALQNGVVLCGGIVPIVVRAGEISSLVAAALSSTHYHQQLHASLQTKGIGSDLDDKDLGSSREKLETDGKSKNSKTNEHIDVQLQDGLFCCIYHPKQFLKLRSVFLCPLKSNPNIKNDFDLKQSNAEESNLKNTDSKSDIYSDSTEDGKHAVSSDRESIYSVEASPIMSLKKISDDKAKRASRDSQGKFNNGTVELSDIEQGFIRSLSRCVPWAARGGKSGSTFCKTKDDRYILKEMSKLELQLFIELAPHYFNYIQTCHKNNLPTLLARIFGVYRVSGVEGIGGGVLVMENLWHGRTGLSKRFDLKGAERNRLAEQGAPDVVLLDENLLNLRWDSPLYLQSHSTSVLWAAIERDTTFLSTHHVMDYSLLVGLDEEKHELVLGIIDYIRTFTWDKKLEHIVKKGLGSGLPTIVSPEQYKIRFCSAMKKYFLQSPNQWEELDKGLICNVVEDS